MRLQNVQNNIRDLFALFVTQVKAAGAMSQTDINRVSETVLIPLFAEVYGFRKLRNLNEIDGPNFPGIDLGDEQAEVAIQVTSTPGSDKVKHTLEMFVKYELYRKYKRLIIYVLTEKQKSYSGSGFEDIIEGRFSFDKDRDIKDYTDLLEEISTFPLHRSQSVQRVLEANFGEDSVPLFKEEIQHLTEVVFLNLLELYFPDTLYIADIDIDHDAVIKASKEVGKRLWKNSPTREVVIAAYKQMGLNFGVDWICHANQIVTFHNLDDQYMALHKVIDPGTVTPLTPAEFYSYDSGQEQAFKQLIQRCLQQKLYHEGVQWQKDKQLYIFADEDELADETGDRLRQRKEVWYGKKKNPRTVFEEVRKRNKPEEISHFKHFAFQTRILLLGGKWFLLLRPEWFFSFDGYRPDFYGSEKVDYLKKNERNGHVFNHLRFIEYFFKHNKPSTLFRQRTPYPFLSFGDYIEFDSAPSLDDKEWIGGESTEDKKTITNSSDEELPLIL